MSQFINMHHYYTLYCDYFSDSTEANPPFLPHGFGLLRQVTVALFFGHDAVGTAGREHSL